ncbi:MFS transporter [Metabacillus sp. 113a]|uniref:MFS transporter n=1 Tax=Metabacillus sp. 113a TaxID=3404706 RepID=UPI003CECA0CB
MLPANKRLHVIIQITIVFTGFLLFGLSENIRGPAVPRIQADFQLEEWQIGHLFAINSLGFLIACSFTAYLTRHWGLKTVTQLTFGLMALSGVLIYFSRNFEALSGAYFLLYIGNGMLEIVLALIATRIFVKNTGTMMNLAHFFYGLSSIAAPMIATGVMELTIGGVVLDWRGMYAVILALCVLPMIPAFYTRFAEQPMEEEEPLSVKRLLRDPVIWLISLLLSLGVIAELSVGGWLIHYLENGFGWSTLEASKMLSAFFLFFTFARLILGPITDKIGYLLSIILFSALFSVLIIAGIYFGERGAILIAIAGAGVAPVYPTANAFIARRYRSGTDAAITVVVTIVGISGVLGNYAIGGVISITETYVSAVQIPKSSLLAGLQAGFYFIAVCGIACSVITFYLYRYLKRRDEIL